MSLIVSLVSKRYNLDKIISKYPGDPILVAGKVESIDKLYDHIRDKNSIVIYDSTDTFDYDLYVKYALECGKEVTDLGATE